jgi:hypothetical protein
MQVRGATSEIKMNYPSTTTILKASGLYGDIERWTARAAEERRTLSERYERDCILAAQSGRPLPENPLTANTCSDRAQSGRVIDGACNLLAMRKELPDTWRAKHETCCVPFVEGYEKLLRKHKVVLVRCAYEVINAAERYCGHPDQRVLLDDVPALFDIKSAEAMPAHTDLQIWSYLRAERAMEPANKDLYSTSCVGVQLSRGDYKLHYYTNPRVGDEFIIHARWYHSVKSRMKEAIVQLGDLEESVRLEVEGEIRDRFEKALAS